MQRLVLASGSVYRKQLLEMAGFEVDVIVPGVLEPDLATFPDLESGLIYLATWKARTAWQRILSGGVPNGPPTSNSQSLSSTNGEHSPHKSFPQEAWPPMILAADTISVVGEQILGKPDGIQSARRMLEALSNGTHHVLTGWCVLRVSDQLITAGTDSTEITMRKWSDSEIDTYLESGEWEGKCGAYGLEWPHDPFVTNLTGSVSNVIGIPVERIKDILNQLPER